MNNIVSYAKEHMESFDVRPLNRVDSLILSELSYFQLPQELSKARGWRGVRLAELFRAECFEQMFDGVWDGESCRQLLTALSASPRFQMCIRDRSHPVCLTSKGGLSIEMEKVLNSMPTDQKVQAERVLEIKAQHPILETLQEKYAADKDSIAEYAKLLYDQEMCIRDRVLRPQRRR